MYALDSACGNMLRYMPYAAAPTNRLRVQLQFFFLQFHLH